MSFLQSLFPVFSWSKKYGRDQLTQDLVAGLVVLFITVPQVIAYAFLAGLPAETGLYAAIAALLGYAIFGSSTALAVGPTAIIAMMTLEAVSSHATPGTAEYQLVAIQLAAITGLLLIALRIVNFGSVISFLSHAVVTGFITAAAILIMTNQLPLLLGIGSAADTSIVGVVTHMAEKIDAVNMAALLISLGSIGLLLFCRGPLGGLLKSLGLSERLTDNLVKSAPMYAVIIGIVTVWLLALDTGQALPVVGDIPAALPEPTLALFSFEQLQLLLPSALLIAMVVFMESTSIGTAMASKRREKIDANQELMGLGSANLGASLLGGFPVAGSFARSIVNFSAGAVSPVASVITALLVVLTILVFAGAFYFLPKAVLSAIIVISACQLIDVDAIRKIFAFNTTDAVTFTFTFFAVLSLGVESGVLIGIAISFVLLIRSSSRPHIVVVGRMGETENFRNIARYPDAKHVARVLAVRVDESLYFVNTRFIETFIFDRIAESEEIEEVVLICTAANFIDTSGLEMLEELSENLHEVGVTLHLAEVKGPVMDKLRETEFFENMHGQVFFTTSMAMKELADI